MTTRTTDTIERTTIEATETDEGAGLGHTARQVAGTAATAASDIMARLPDAADAARGAVDEADRLLRDRSEQSLALAGMLSAGLAGGLLIGGVHRWLVIASLVPSIVIAATLADRRGRATS